MKCYDFHSSADNNHRMHTITITMWGYDVFIPNGNGQPGGRVQYIRGGTIPFSFSFDAPVQAVQAAMELNEAITEWRQIIPPYIYEQFRDDLHEVVLKALPNGEKTDYVLAAVCPALSQRVTHPVGFVNAELARVIMSLNDTYKWSRERIADWLETLDLDISFAEGAPV